MPSSSRVSNLHTAAIHGTAADVEEYLQQGAAIDQIDRTGVTPLILAVTSNRIDVLVALLAHGADTEVTDRYGNTALWAALFRSDDGATIRLLLNAGANPDHVNNAGRSPRTLANTVTNIDLKQYFT